MDLVGRVLQFLGGLLGLLADHLREGSQCLSNYPLNVLLGILSHEGVEPPKYSL